MFETLVPEMSEILWSSSIFLRNKSHCGATYLIIHTIKIRKMFQMTKKTINVVGCKRGDQHFQSLGPWLGLVSFFVVLLNALVLVVVVIDSVLVVVVAVGDPDLVSTLYYTTIFKIMPKQNFNIL